MFGIMYVHTIINAIFVKLLFHAIICPNGALNISKKATGMLILGAAKPLSYLVFHNGAAAVKGV